LSRWCGRNVPPLRSTLYLAGRYNLSMRITKGKVVDGQIVVEGESLTEGSVVTVLVSDERTFTLMKRKPLFWKRLVKRIGET